MFFPIDNLNSYWQSFYQLYGDDIQTLTDSWFNDEDIVGRSCKQYKLYQYYFAFYLGVLIKNELDKGYNSNYNYYKHKYQLDKHHNSLACNNISLDKILSIFNMNFTNNEGIEGMGIEDNFIIEPNYTNSHITIDINTLLNYIPSCISIFNNC